MITLESISSSSSRSSFLVAVENQAELKPEEKKKEVKEGGN